MKGRLVILKEIRKMKIDEYEVPDPEPGALVAKIAMAGVCGSDLHNWRGDQSPQGLPPGGRTVGHEWVGIVHKLGKGVTTDSLGKPLKEGDRICAMQVFPCHRCYVCLRGEYNFCPNQGLSRKPDDWPYFSGAYADFFYLPPRHNVYKVPDELSNEVLTSVNCAWSTVLTGLMTADASEGEYAVILGAGGLGIAATALAKDMGVDRVIVMDRLEKRLDLAEQFGADFTVNVEEFNTADSRIRRVQEITDGRGADIVMDLVGIPDLVPEGIEMTRPGGIFMEIGDIIPGRTVSIDPSRLLRGKRIVGSNMYRPWAIPKVLDFMVKNRDKIPFDNIVSHTFKLDDINEAFEKAEWLGREPEVTRACIVP